MKSQVTLLCIVAATLLFHSHGLSTTRPWACYNNLSQKILEPPATCPAFSGARSTLIAKGTSGTTRKFTDPVSGHVVVVKTHGVRHADESEQDYLAYIHNEHKIASNLWHPNVVETYDLYQGQEGGWHQVMEYLPIQFTALEWDSETNSQTLLDSLFVQVLTGVAYLHSAGVAHMDIKIENLGLTHDGTVKIFDFGSSLKFRGDDGRPLQAQGMYSPAYHR
jgi:serine/threonine protein kinase